MKKFNILSFVLLIFLLSTGCKKELLEVKNQNQPDFKLVYSNGDDVQNVASGLFNTIFNGMHAFAGTQLMLAVASDNISCSWGNAGMRDMSYEPRNGGWNNSPSYSNAG